MPASVDTTGLQTSFDVARVRADFPALHQRIYDGRPLVYLDNAATTQKPQVVIDRIRDFYARENANVHRGVHYLSQLASDAYDEARRLIAAFIGAPDPSQVIFTRGTTESINLVAATYGRQCVGPGDEIVLSAMEHHSNIVPWQILCEEKGAHLRVVPVDEQGVLDLEALEHMLGERTRLVAIAHVSNALGTVNPVREIIQMAHARGIPVLIDGAQAVQHLEVNVAELDCDFYCFSGHKMYGPTGIGILYGKAELLEAMPPYQGGGDMIERVTFERTTYNRLPYKFEAGTPHIAGAIGLGAAVTYLNGLDRAAIARYEDELLRYATERLQEVPGLRLIGTAPHKVSVLSFVLDGVHPYDAGTLLDQMGIAVRTGHHCAQPLMDRLGLSGTIRASLALYNTREEIDALVQALYRVVRLLR
ncbi:cysteine desulfurase [Rhodothermus profundi]|uniref:Cysteine desulfurase n=1 Tax=Rhodothermus profundi TaxID=633813 RepID=A0A1M6PRK2_9BACT|nr:cysteine desulfurase [Rhodothermus profundi]SHK10580.1 L-selenocysteine selenide-lyase (L-alanine-forming) [Rhodothermus profundi]